MDDQLEISRIICDAKKVVDINSNDESELNKLVVLFNNILTTTYTVFLVLTMNKSITLFLWLISGKREAIYKITMFFFLDTTHQLTTGLVMCSSNFARTAYHSDDDEKSLFFSIFLRVTKAPGVEDHPVCDHEEIVVIETFLKSTVERNFFYHF